MRKNEIRQQIKDIVAKKDEFEYNFVIFGSHSFSYITKKNVKIVAYISYDLLNQNTNLKIGYKSKIKEIELNEEEEKILFKAFYPKVEKILEEEKKSTNELFNNLEL